MNAERGEPVLPHSVHIPGEDPRLLVGPAEPTDLVISIHRATADGEIVVSLDGEVDMHAAERVRFALTGAARTPGCHHLRVDLTAVPFIDSTGLGALVNGCKAAIAVGATFSLTNAQPVVRRSLEVTNLAGPLGLSPTTVRPRTPPP
jgi:anti-sigma B factor antagonist